MPRDSENCANRDPDMQALVVIGRSILLRTMRTYRNDPASRMNSVQFFENALCTISQLDHMLALQSFGDPVNSLLRQLQVDFDFIIRNATTCNHRRAKFRREFTYIRDSIVFRFERYEYDRDYEVVMDF